MARINPEYVARIQTTFRASPYPAHMSMTLDALDRGSCTIALEIKPEHFQPFGVVHGGVLATLIDTATFWAAFLSLERPDDGMASVDLKLNYLAPVFGGKLVATGRQLHRGKRLSYTEAHVLNIGERGEQLVAHGTSTLMALPGKGIALDIPRELGS